MPAKDIYHQTVKIALVKDGWTITHNSYRIRLARGKNLFVDLGAERLIAADRDTEKIAVEIKSFTRASDMKDARGCIRSSCPLRPFANPLCPRANPLSCSYRGNTQNSF